MKKNRLVLPVLILLFILITPCAIYGTYVVVSKKIAGENPNHLHKFNGKLYYYDENDNLLVVSMLSIKSFIAFTHCFA